MVRKATSVNQGDLLEISSEFMQPAERAGVRALIVAMKSRNGDGAKGRRKVET